MQRRISKVYIKLNFSNRYKKLFFNKENIVITFYLQSIYFIVKTNTCFIYFVTSMYVTYSMRGLRTNFCIYYAIFQQHLT